MIAPILISGCKGRQVRSISQEAYDLFNQGNYEASLKKYAQIIEKHPAVSDRVLFEMGIIYAYPSNEQKDYQKSLECFQKIVRDFPEGEYRLDSQMMILEIQNVIIKDRIIAKQQTQIERSHKEIKDKENEIVFLKEKIDTLENKIFALRTEPADKVLIEKKARRLTLLSMGEVIKTYKIAIGVNPIGAKEKRGDNKTPEGTYIIDSRNSESDYHLSLNISYPNEKDKMRAKALGVSPGGDIMIHGIKNGYMWVGASHTEFDWTNGCIAVTNEEMEEIYRLVPNGTVVEIRP
jgi:L,D-peptidoglycan transpeptidase YkuD (ErfK/YbiS/YcfS/YnhG family)